MPQINRVRVNNVKYNFGTQFYDDFIMRFNGKNAIYDLANGGGKSLLMLLLLQNMLPNCTLDDKQPIEKLFRAGGGNTVIHSLVEWKLDSCYQKDNYKYMTTGFCARKGRSTDDEGQHDNLSSASVEYFNYCIFYREFGDNDIKNLPLASDGERITYNGLKTYLRELEKNDFNVSVCIFDRKGDYQSFISQYGIFESAWEIVRGINKTEGHVRTYFETNYRTSRKVVEDLLIEEIIQKSFNNRLAVDNDEGRMAQTLMDIKDKLVELSKKHAQMSDYDSQMSALAQFAEYVKSFEDLYARKDKTAKMLFNMLLAVKCIAAQQEERLSQGELLLEKMKSEMAEENCHIAAADIMSQQNSLEGMKELIGETKAGYDSRHKELKLLEEELRITESAADYADYRQYEKALKELEETMKNRLREHSDIVNELNELAAAFYKSYQAALESNKESLKSMESDYASTEAELEKEKQLYREADLAVERGLGLKEYTQKLIKQYEADMADKLSERGMLVAENAQAEADKAGRSLDMQRAGSQKAEAELEAARNDFDKCSSRLMEAEAALQMYEKELELLSGTKTRSDMSKTKLEKLFSIYGAETLEQLIHITLDTYRRMEAQSGELTDRIKELKTFINNAGEGTYSCKDTRRDKLKQYLESQYGEDVVEGHDWFKMLTPGQKRDVIKRTPFVEYSFVIKGDFERIKNDAVLSNFERGACVYPVISEQVLIDTKLEINKDLIVFAMKDMSFLRDDARCEAEIRAAMEEVKNLEAGINKNADRQQMVWEDYTFVLVQSANSADDTLEQSIKELTDKIAGQKRELEKLKNIHEAANNRLERVKQQVESSSRSVEELTGEFAALQKIADMYAQITEEYEKLSQLEDTVRQNREKLELAAKRAAKLEKDCSQAAAGITAKRNELEKLKHTWQLTFAEYYDEKTSASGEALALSMEEIESRFLGLKAVLTQENSDFGDKEKLMNHYRLSMHKCVQSMEYRGTVFDEVRQKVKNGEVPQFDGAQCMKLKGQIKRLRSQLNETDGELEAQNALLNRLEGSIAHGINQLEQRYGSYEPFPCDNPESFVKQHKELVKKLEDSLKNQEAAIKKLAAENKNTQVIMLDLERIVENAGMKLPVNINPQEIKDIDVEINKYAEIQKEYAAIQKLELKKADEFGKHKQKLIAALESFNGQELASEVRISVRLPENITQTGQLADNLNETNTFIQLEKERVTKGIDDMERIKDNFENRCIQTCCNIKTELDRLPKLSNITLDGKQISIISLMIPYVKEDMYKERMSAYIDETIVVAESFKTPEERLKYIRSRLTWKRLFSVIVTDMNFVRINLYKRERIKEQSRYLRYEEAVGSTGQSQGIYIQFLIAIINYISNMNAASKETTLVGKTIFIDNPFGAAKDIYIWEPIFKMLATNHVQLIVPARGATPAITGRFPVNYILGQKLVDKRQQTVVVDYYSQTNETQLEYTRMDYQQASFDFL
ncbi:MAG: hypothetical protein Q4F11_00485 [Eubacteriales bacterium]|nr:hypothetical protein [Eubacteriales bacterium]